MECSIQRELTFKMPEGSTARDLARNGLYFDEYFIACHGCPFISPCIILSSQDTIDYHKSVNKNCIYHKMSEAAKDCKKSEPCASVTDIIERNSNYSPALPTRIQPPLYTPHSTLYYCEQDRFRSFIFDFHPTINPVGLAKHGLFHYDGLVRCYACDLVTNIQTWNGVFTNDMIKYHHENLSNDCHHYQNSNIRNKPLNKAERVRNLESFEDWRQKLLVLQYTQNIQRRSFDMFPGLRSFRTRFTNTSIETQVNFYNKSVSLDENIAELSRRGFFYTCSFSFPPLRQCIWRCYSCRGEVRQWQLENESLDRLDEVHEPTCKAKQYQRMETKNNNFGKCQKCNFNVASLQLKPCGHITVCKYCIDEIDNCQNCNQVITETSEADVSFRPSYEYLSGSFYRLTPEYHC